jgi:hypothetical protein
MQQPTKEQVIQAAQKFPNSKHILKELWPQAFVNNERFMDVGQLFFREGYPHVYAIMRVPQEKAIKIGNISQSRFWNDPKMIREVDMYDINRNYITVSEFQKLSGYTLINHFYPLIRKGNTLIMQEYCTDQVSDI